MTTLANVCAVLAVLLWSPVWVFSAVSAYTEYLWHREPERVLSAGVIAFMLGSVTICEWNTHYRMGILTQLFSVYSYLIQWFRSSRLVQARNAAEKGAEALKDACASIHRHG